jgi:hypothetical protein
MALRAARAAALLLALAVPAAALGPNLVIKTPAQLVQAIKDRAEVSADTISPCVAYSIQMATPDAQGNLPSFQRTWDNNNVNDIWYSRVGHLRCLDVFTLQACRGACRVCTTARCAVQASGQRKQPRVGV